MDQGLREVAVVPSTPNEQGVSPDSILLSAGTTLGGTRRLYTPEFLQRHLDRFEGAFSYMDHPRRTEERDLPERSVGRLAAVVRNVRFTPGLGAQGQGAVVGDIHYLDTDAGRNMQALFRDETVRSRAGLSIYWPGQFKVRKHGGGREAITEVTELMGDRRFDVDFVTEPSAGGVVSPLREGENQDMDMVSMTLDQLEEQNPQLVQQVVERLQTSLTESLRSSLTESLTQVITESLAEAATTSEGSDESATDDEATAGASEESLSEAVRQRLEHLERRDRLHRAEAIVQSALCEAALVPAAQTLIEEQFAGAECSEDDAASFTARVTTLVGRVNEVQTSLSEAGRVRGVGRESVVSGAAELRKQNEGLVDYALGHG